jgi:hypothetical protein
MSTSATTTTRDVSDRASQASPANTVKNIAELAGRGLLSVLFLLSGVGKIGLCRTAAYMSKVGVPDTASFSSYHRNAWRDCSHSRIRRVAVAARRLPPGS